MACRGCIGRWVAERRVSFTGHYPAAAQLAEEARLALLATCGPDVELPRLRAMGAHGPLLQPEGHEPPRVCASCDVVFCPRLPGLKGAG